MRSERGLMRLLASNWMAHVRLKFCRGASIWGNFSNVVNPRAYLTDTSSEFVSGGQTVVPQNGVEVKTQFALMAGAERLFGRAGVSHSI